MKNLKEIPGTQRPLYKLLIVEVWAICWLKDLFYDILIHFDDRGQSQLYLIKMILGNLVCWKQTGNWSRTESLLFPVCVFLCSSKKKKMTTF